MSRLLLALPLAVLLIAAPTMAEPASVHVAAAKKAAKANNWNKALEEWKLAYRIEPNSDFLIGMGDAYAKMGDKANARKQYNAYLADPLGLDTDSVKGKLAALDKPSGGDDLSLDLTGPAPAKPKATASNDLDLLGPPPSKPPPKKVAAADLSLDLTGPAPAKPKATASNDLDLLGPPPSKAPPKKPAASDLSLDLAGPTTPPPPKPAPARPADALSLDLVGPAPSKPAPVPAKPATADALSLDIVGPAPSKPGPAKSADPLSLDLVGPAPSKPPAAVATNNGKLQPGPTTGPSPSSNNSNNGKLAVTQPPPKQPPAPPVATTHQAPPESVAVVHTEPRGGGDRNQKIIAYSTAGLAVGALVVGGLYYSKGSTAQSDAIANASNRGSDVQANEDTARKDKSLGVGAFIVGVGLAAIATAVFVF